MKGLCLHLLMVGALLAVARTSALGGDSTNRVVTFALKDQFDKDLILQPPFTKPVLVTIADKEGAAELDGWIQPLKQAFPGQIQFFAIADLRSVAAPFRGLVRRGFRKEYSHPIAMDWRGAAAGQMNVVKDRANIFLLDGCGCEVLSFHEAATEAHLNQVKEHISDLLSRPASDAIVEDVGEESP